MRNSGQLVEIISGKYEGMIGIAYHKKQQKIFLADKKFILTIFSDMDFKNKVAENVAIHTSKLKGIGMCD